MSKSHQHPNNFIEENSTSTPQSQDWLVCDQKCFIISAIGMVVGIAMILVILYIIFAPLIVYLCAKDSLNVDLENQGNQSSSMESNPMPFSRTSSLPTYEIAVLQDRLETPPPKYYKLFFIEKSTPPMASIAEQ